jgi:ribosome recycling factor
MEDGLRIKIIPREEYEKTREHRVKNAEQLLKEEELRLQRIKRQHRLELKEQRGLIAKAQHALDEAKTETYEMAIQKLESYAKERDAILVN